MVEDICAVFYQSVGRLPSDDGVLLALLPGSPDSGDAFGGDSGGYRIEHRAVYRSSLGVLHRLHDRKSAVGIAPGLRGIADGHAGGCSDLESGERFACVYRTW